MAEDQDTPILQGQSKRTLAKKAKGFSKTEVKRVLEQDAGKRL